MAPPPPHSLRLAVCAALVLLVAGLPTGIALPWRRAPHAAPTTGRGGPGRLDLLAALRDEPVGAYKKLVEPLIRAIHVAYFESIGPDFGNLALIPSDAEVPIPSESAGGGHWEHVPGLDQDSGGSGVHTKTFVDHVARRVVIAFRGSCWDAQTRQCQLDACFLTRSNGMGNITDKWFGNGLGANCSELAGRENYLEQANGLVRRVQAAFRDYAVLLTGHSMGGSLATVTAARQPGVLQAVSWCPSNFQGMLSEGLGLSRKDVEALPAEDLIALGDPYDLMLNDAFVVGARNGATTCTYEDLEEPAECNPKMKNATYIELNFEKMEMCKAKAHSWARYQQVALGQTPSGAPAHVPSCSVGLSGLQGRAVHRVIGAGHMGP